jgi:O-antigen/teichoic acid export membrane protein
MEVLEKKRIVQNITWLTISKVFVYLLSIVTISLIPRYLGVQGYGQLNFVLSLIGIFSIFANLGVHALILRDVSRKTSLKEKYFNNLFFSKLFLIFFASFLMIIFGLFTDKPIIVKQMILLGLFYMLFSNTITFFNRFLSSLQLFKYQAYSDFFSKLIYTVLALLVIYFNQGLIGIFLSHIIAFLIVSVSLYFTIKKYIKVKLKVNFNFLLEKLKYSWPFALIVVFSTIFFNFDKIFISLYIDDVQLGLYSVGVTFITFLITITSFFSVVFYNLFSKYSFKKEVLPILNKYLRMVLLISFPILFGGIYLSKEIILLVFGSSYVLGSTSFAILLFFFFIISINTVFIQLLNTHYKEKFVLYLRGITTGLNVLLNIIFIPIYGIVGAAITTVFSEVIVFLFSYKKVKSLYSFSLFSQTPRILLSSIIMFLAIYIFKYFIKIRFFNNSFDVLFIIGICGFIYLICLFIFRVISIKEIRETISSFKS